MGKNRKSVTQPATLDTEDEAMPIPEGGERPKSLLDWIYKLSWLLIVAVAYGQSLYVSNNYLSKTENEKMRREDREELATERRGVEARQQTIIEQQQQILIAIAEVKVHMESNKQRDDAIGVLQTKLEALQTYVYTHPVK